MRGVGGRRRWEAGGEEDGRGGRGRMKELKVERTSSFLFLTSSLMAPLISMFIGRTHSEGFTAQPV